MGKLATILFSYAFLVLAYPSLARAKELVDLPDGVRKSDIKRCDKEVDRKIIKSITEKYGNNNPPPGTLGFRLYEQLDLNDDGVCELIFTEWGGTGGDSYTIFEIAGESYRKIGNIDGFEYSIKRKKNGYYQLSSGIRGGGGNWSVLVYTYQAGRYQITHNVDSKSIRNYAKEGQTQYRKRDYTSAADLFKKALVKIPDHWSSMVDLGLTYFRLKKYDESISISLKVLKSPPQSPPNWGASTKLKGNAAYNIGKVYEAQGMIKEAYKYYLNSYELEPNKTRQDTLSRIKKKYNHLLQST